MVTSTSLTIFPSSLISGKTTPIINHQVMFLKNHYLNNSVPQNNRVSFSVQAQAEKSPIGVEFPKVEPQIKAPFVGFTNTAEVWNSRASMIGLIGAFIVELMINKGILEVIGVEVGKGLNLPL
ncbi:putative chlorophyll a/b binding protein [Lupinus albus]|uniref:Putative chlorophyll a/b binding protein n=1 Tax=Lupinus albus TaxID=3870 RepID=A0A6A4R5K9_LUPAL|nr:putative chlorophyll a/b binding protein [Lupinus albus]